MLAAVQGGGSGRGGRGRVAQIRSCARRFKGGRVENDLCQRVSRLGRAENVAWRSARDSIPGDHHAGSLRPRRAHTCERGLSEARALMAGGNRASGRGGACSCVRAS